jgi:hypothetical protein
MVSPDYYTSERFIEDALIKRVETGIATLYDTWKREKRITPFVILWPADAVKDREGIEIEGPCLRELDADKTQWRRQLVEAIGLANAYALALIQQQDERVLVILESQHGVVNWVLPILRSGDIRILGRSKMQRGGEQVGLLWSPTGQPS